MQEIRRNEEGMETTASICRRAAEFTGFHVGNIVPREATYKDGVCDGFYFTVLGVGIYTDLAHFWRRVESYDAVAHPQTPTQD